jgi:hypothetical protein
MCFLPNIGSFGYYFFRNQKQELPGLAKQFQRRLKCENLRTDNGCQVMAKAHIAFGKVS